MSSEIYQFTLVLKGVNPHTLNLEDRLFDADCDDALVNFRMGTVYLQFDRCGDNAKTAILSAVIATECALPEATVVRIEPEDYVSITEIANRVKVKRQAVSLWVNGERCNKVPFPSPVSKLTDKSPLWRWHEVVRWLQQQNKLNDNRAIEFSSVIATINTALQLRNRNIYQETQEILQQLRQ